MKPLTCSVCKAFIEYPPEVQAVIDATKEIGKANIVITGEVGSHDVYGVPTDKLLKLITAVRAYEAAEEGER